MPRGSVPDRCGPLSVLALVLLAGCAGLGGPLGGTGTPTDTALTPASVPEVERVAPGVTAQAVENDTALLAAHERALRNTSRTVRTRVVIRYRNGSRHFEARVRRARREGESRYRYEVLAGGLPRREWTTRETWRNRTVGVRRDRLPNGTTRLTRTAPIQPAVVPNSRIPAILAEQGGRVTAVRGDRAVLVAPGTTLDPFADSPVVYDARPSRLRAVVTDEGLVRNVTLTYNATGDGRPVTVRYTRSVQRVGRTSVDRPAWVRDALRNRSRTGRDGAD